MYERLFDKLVGCSGEYTVSENEKQNVAFRGIPVTLVSKFCMELSESHSAPTTSKEVNSTEDPAPFSPTHHPIPSLQTTRRKMIEV